MDLLDRLTSTINDSVDALDRDKAFTFIEFVKVSGFDCNDNSFISLYKDYLTRWAQKQNYGTHEETEFVKLKLVEILKTITLTYTSYEEKQFIAKIDWNDIESIKTIIPTYVKRMKEICDFYKNKRDDVFLIVEKNKRKGSTVALEQIIFETIVDFVFNHKNVLPQISEIKRDLSISMENYIDIYSDYFDIPRDKSLRDRNNDREYIEANMNDVDYRDYIEINTVIAEIIYAGEVYLEEIPLIANLGIDFSQECVGTLLEVKNKLIAEATINLVPLTEKISLRRRLYEKYIGCDLYYMYVDEDRNVKMDLLVKAKNPSGNLLNCGSPDTVTTPGNKLELLTNIGLFFKPDKTSILKVNAKQYTWEVDASKLQEDTVYVFPDPNKYGDIGNNKDPNYPLIMEYKLDYDIRNLSSGASCDDPLVFFDSQVFSSYYSKQQDDFKLVENKNFEYSFTSLENFGILQNYQTDSYGNEFAIFKGYKEVYVEDESGNKHLDHVEVPENIFPETKYPTTEEEENKRPAAMLINGGYFEDPYHPKKAFDFTKKLKINDNYLWTSIILGEPPLITPRLLYDAVNFGEFGSTNGIVYIDHFGYTESQIEFLEDKGDVVTEYVEDFYTKLFDGTDQNVPVKKVKKNFVDLSSEEGTVFVKLSNSIESKPQNFMSVFSWLPDEVKEEKIVSFSVFGTTIILETKNKFVFIKYTFDGQNILKDETIKKFLIVDKGPTASNVVYVAKENAFFFVILNEYIDDKGYFMPAVYKFSPVEYTIKEVYNAWNLISELSEEFDKIKKAYKFASDYIKAKKAAVDKFIADPNNVAIIQYYLQTDTLNLNNFAFNYEGENYPSIIKLTHNSSLNTFLLAYIINSNNGFPYIYQHTFKLLDDAMFRDTIKSRVFVSEEQLSSDYIVWNEVGAGKGKTVPADSQFFVEI